MKILKSLEPLSSLKSIVSPCHTLFFNDYAERRILFLFMMSNNSDIWKIYHNKIENTHKKRHPKASQNARLFLYIIIQEIFTRKLSRNCVNQRWKAGELKKQQHGDVAHDMSFFSESAFVINYNDVQKSWSVRIRYWIKKIST